MEKGYEYVFLEKSYQFVRRVDHMVKSLTRTPLEDRRKIQIDRDVFAVKQLATEFSFPQELN